MKNLTTSPMLFGVDISRLGQYWKLALQDMRCWPLLSWLWPRFDVQISVKHAQPQRLVIRPQGLAELMSGPGKEGRSSSKQIQQANQFAGRGAAAFHGWLLPADILLVHSLDMPRLLPEQNQAAAELEIERLSPFDREDLVFAWHCQPMDRLRQRLTVLITARSLAKRALPDFDSDRHELWAELPGVSQYILMAGFGEARRLEAQRRLSWGLWILVIGMMLTVFGLAATPALQASLRAKQAHAALESSIQRAAPATRAREEMLVQKQRVKSLESLVSQRLVPEHTLLLLTRYLPDNTYVTSLEITERQIQLSGLTPNAAAFMANLGAQPGISKVIAVHEARRENSRPGSREIFTIEFMLDTSLALTAEPLGQAVPPASAPDAGKVAVTTAGSPARAPESKP